MTPTRHSPAVVAVALLLAVLAAGRRGAEAGGDKSDCSVAQTAFSECTGYVAGLDDEIPPQCCQGLGDLKDMAPGANQRRDLCACILSEMLAAGKVDSGRAAGLPSACGLSVGFLPTSPDFDCSQIP
ncbi:non-specific lipid-transfer protein P3-like [Hordeum vulgare subsp. vulgare]|uniref:Non-specific lipid-transfer protein n=1 Tax=Hordeum vulgare subsp. vulgare TaxID=112509 RepID=A0A8I6YS27_HORVV|nr:non-specific lipid-transfer protein P3-like [Hordeum vulgare subsp. vulgare]